MVCNLGSCIQPAGIWFEAGSRTAPPITPLGDLEPACLDNPGPLIRPNARSYERPTPSESLDWSEIPFKCHSIQTAATLEPVFVWFVHHNMLVQAEIMLPHTRQKLFSSPSVPYLSCGVADMVMELLRLFLDSCESSCHWCTILRFLSPFVRKHDVRAQP